MSTTESGNARAGKYCPRCRTMTFRDSEACEHCGHRFRTGLGTGLGASPPDAPITDDAMLHRTMQFTLPPLPPRGEAASPASPPGTDRGLSDPPGPRRRGASFSALLAGAVVLTLLGVWSHFQYAPTARAARPSPVGTWDVRAGRASADARLRFVFRDGGGGSFSWAAGSAPPLSGQAPLRWRVEPDGRLALSITPPAAPADPSGPLISLLSRRPWLWRVDRTQHRLVLGSLRLTETT